MNPYEILGVPKDADDATIKRAYRKLVAKAHPDVGGDPEEFHKLQAAYECLKDPESRAYYDQHGIMRGQKAEQVDPKRAQAIHTLVSAFDAACAMAEGDFAFQDLIAYCGVALDEMEVMTNKGLEELPDARKKIQTLLDRLTVKEDVEEDPLSAIWRSRLESFDRREAVLNDSLESIVNARAILANYTYRTDKKDPEMHLADMIREALNTKGKSFTIDIGR